MESQPEPVTLSWEHINVFTKLKKKQTKTVPVDAENGTATPQVQTVQKKEKKQILHDVTGLVEPGTLLAVLGASGSGKSTMMNVLSDKNLRQYDIQGQVKVNGRVVGSGIRNISAYVQQDELFFTTLTVRETLRFRAMLRMDNTLNKEARLQRVEEVIQEMGLSKCANTQIGGTGSKRGISGGELKRLSFAAETLTNPALVFCDEPTSGLDSFMARRVVQALQFMASKNRTVICVIHQPSSEVFSMFDRLLLMAEGRLAFLGTSDQAAQFFSRMNYICPPNYNPSDYYVLTLAIEPGKEDECREKVNAICEAFKSTSGAIENQQVIDDVAGHSKVFEEAFSNESRYEASWGKQFVTVLWRSWVSVFRNVFLFRVRAIQTVVFALLLGLVYLQQDYDQQGVQNINGALFLIVLNISFTSALSIVNSFPHELPVFLREYGTGLYRTDVYFLAKDLAELPSFVLLPFVYISILYWMIDLNNDWQSFLICGAIVVLVANVAGSLGVMVSTLAGDVSVALSLIAPIMIPLILFGGFFLNSDTVPVYFVWLEHLSWFKYAMEIISVNQWDTIDTIECAANTTCFYSTGDDVLRYLGYSSDNTWLNVGVLLALLVGLRFLSFLCLLIRARRSKS